MPSKYDFHGGHGDSCLCQAVLQHRPRRSSQFHLHYVFGLWLDWPLLTFLVLVASTALAIDQSGVDSPWLWIGLRFAVIASAGLVVLRRVAQGTGPALERALDEGLGADWRGGVNAELAARLRRRPSLARILLAPLFSRRRGVERITNIRYGPARRANLLDLYRDRSDRSSRPVLIHLHPISGSKRLGTRYLFHRLAGEGWICVGANYRRASDDEFSDPLIDVKKVIAWMREHGPGYTPTPAAIVAGSSLGGHLAALTACMPRDPMLQPGFGSPDASVAGIISLYGYYGDVAPGGPPTSRLPYTTTNAPPCFVAHGDRDTLVIVEDARGFVEQLRATSSEPGGLRRAARRRTPGSTVAAPDAGHCRRCDRGIRSAIASAGSPRPTRSRSDDAYPISGSVCAGKEANEASCTGPFGELFRMSGGKTCSASSAWTRSSAQAPTRARVESR